ncbi:PPOX class F420-dependent oxidoreductase [Streptacidiphilus monticola]|jgi:PPOX class probable F420-dependent enzyme|uniref:PPOX class F420-dependent oxidoreductase n=1 Tax=Streptacidiphilus monticola TaxID=2161674 RepID=A0ABW1FU73_9ACTN
MTSATALNGRARTLVDDRSFAIVSTLQPDGSPHQSVMWVTRDGDDLLLSTLVGRRKEQNLRRDPRISVLIYPREKPYTYLEVRGVAELTREGGRELIDALSRKYTGADYTADGPDDVRVVVRVRARKVVDKLGGV